MGKLAEAFVEIGVNDKPVGPGLDRVKSKLTSFAGGVQGLMTGISTAIASTVIGGALMLAAGAVNWLKGAVTQAGDLNETLSKSEVTFGSANAKITGFAENMATQFGTAKREIIDAASSFGLIFKGAGMAEDASAELAITLATAADDAASLFNSTMPEALEKIRAGLVGESEPLRAYGVMLNEAAVQQEAMRLGLAKNKNELSESAKIMARASLIEKGLAVAKGDHARTQGGLNNQMKEFGDRMMNFAAAVGSWFVTPLSIAFKVVNSLLQPLTWLAQKIGGLAAAFSGFNGKAEETAAIADKVNAKAAPRLAGASPGGGGTDAPALAKTEVKKVFDARAEALKDVQQEEEKRAVEAAREKVDAERKEERRKRMDFAIATARGLRGTPSGGAYMPSEDDDRIARQNANFDSERHKIEGFLSAAKEKALGVMGMAAQLKSDALGVAGKVADVLTKKRPKLEGGVTTSDAYATELQNAALKTNDTQDKLLEETKKVPTKLDELIKVISGGGRDIIARFG